MDKSTFLMESVVADLKRAPNSPWIDVLVTDKEPYSDQAGRLSVTRYCALLCKKAIPNARKTSNWDLMIGQGLPGFITGGGEDPKYVRFGSDRGVQPLVILRENHGVIQSFYEVCEEFRHFHNLFENQSGTFVKFSDDGDEIEAIRKDPGRISIKKDLLFQFCAATQKHLALYVDARQFSTSTLEEIGVEDRCDQVNESNFIMVKASRPWEGMGSGKDKSICTLIAKLIVPPKPIEESGVWPFDEGGKVYETFIIGHDENGEETTFTCDPDQLANFFGKNPDAPNFLTPVFFEREVLTKYYAKPSKYSVEDSYLRCQGLWGLRMDNNHERYVIVFLGDLGETLSEKEQKHWRNYNVVPDGTISDVTFKRGFLAEFADPTRSDLRFKMLYEMMAKRWKKRFGWALHTDFHPDDAHCMQTLRVPLTDEMSEFDGQALSLAKVLIDYLNEKDIETELKARGAQLEPNTKGIGKLAVLFQFLEMPSKDQDIGLLKSIQNLRSRGAAHKKGSTFAETYDEVIGKDVKPRNGFDLLLAKCGELLNRWIVFLEDKTQDD